MERALESVSAVESTGSKARTFVVATEVIRENGRDVHAEICEVTVAARPAVESAPEGDSEAPHFPIEALSLEEALDLLARPSEGLAGGRA